MYWYVFSLIEDLKDLDILEDIIQQDGDNTKIKDPATEIIDHEKNPKPLRVQRRSRRPNTKGR